ncbi:unnamed protein product [Vicia faba]|uniref:DDT domain-containing protein DDR4 n=1 Tax=Vicia faba TaxID=3906 RepID=A0AAV0ZNB6_VICFA|nr:unnamed protein product [Vicia faba]
MQTVEEGSGSEDQNARVEETETPLEIEISNLRRRWELASVLNFLDVFSPILGKDLKVSAEEIEIGLVKPNAALAHLHIQLLKGTPPVSKLLNDSDKWVTALSKKLTMWWPWVAEGKNPLVPSKGEEISKYKELDPLDRLLLLKAICEVRADQHDVVSYINDSLKEGTEISSFRKNAFGKVGTSTTYWYDANTKAQSHRLYRETITSVSTPNRKVKGCLSLPNFQWETLASNLEEFSEVAERLSSSKSPVEVFIGKKLQSEAIPVLDKLQKKKEKAMKQKQRQDKLLKDFQNSYSSGNARSCRTRRPVNYSFEAYDRTMKEAIQLTNKRKKSPAANQDRNKGSEDDSTMDVSSDSDDSNRDVPPISESDDSGYEIENHSSSEENDEHDREMDDSEAHSSDAVSYPKGVRCSKRLAGVPGHTVPESIGLAAKQRVRQRPTRNTAIESTVVSDSEDEPHEGKTDLSDST